MYFFDVGSDISFSVQLFNNCHVGYGSAAISIMIVAVLFSCFFPLASAGTDENVYLEACGYLLNYIRLNWRELIGHELSVRFR